MEFFFWVGAVVLALLVGDTRGKIGRLTRRVRELEKQIQASDLPAETPLPAQTSTQVTPRESRPPVTQSNTPTLEKPERDSPRHRDQSTPAEPDALQKLFTHMRSQWMVWLGGACVGFAGIFLARYSMEQGLLGPAARITLALVAGVFLHGVAEYLRRRAGSDQARGQDVFAALAGGASIMLYAALLAGLHLYQLMGPTPVFIALIVVSLATMGLALLHGPVLAAIGILGAFFVPILVSTGSNNIVGALAYSFIITVSALLLVRRVYRHWLWFGTLAGALGWWLLGLAMPQQTPATLHIYLAALAYAVCAIHWWNWRLDGDTPPPADSGLVAVFRQFDGRGRLAGLLAGLVFLSAINLMAHELKSHWLFTLPLLPVFLFWLARQHTDFRLLPWVSFAALTGALVGQWFMQGGEPSTVSPLAWVLLEIGLIYMTLSWWRLRSGAHHGVWASLWAMTPVALLAVGYLRLEVFTVQWEWSVVTALIGAFYLHLAARQARDTDDSLQGQTEALIVSLTLAAHFALALAFVMLFREATLTLALSTQVMSLTWLHKRFGFPLLLIAAKAVLVVIVVRLSLNPWLLGYSTELHWSLWTYGGAVAATWFASRITADMTFRQWLVGASIHLLVLLLWYEVRYWLYDGQVFTGEYRFIEAAINTGLWGTLGLVYAWRAGFSEQLGKLYQVASQLLLVLALMNYAIVVVLAQNPLFSQTEVSETPIFNSLLLAYGVPVLVALGAYRLLPQHQLRSFAGGVSGAALLLFCTLEVRHLWVGDLTLHAPVSDGELYTYSMVWLALAAGGSVYAIRYDRQWLYKGAMLLLVVVVAKIFMVDMSGLSGLLRAASFMGLGLSLLGLAYLHQKFRAGQEPVETG